MTDLNVFIDSAPIEANLSNDDMERLLGFQQTLLVEATSNDSHEDILKRLCIMAEQLVIDSIASIMILQPDGSLIVHTAPSLSSDAIEALCGLRPGEGSCGNAIYHNKPMFVSNTLADDRWASVRSFAEQFEVGACWSFPVHNPSGEVTGSFALSSKAVRHPSLFQRRVLEICASVAGIIFQRDSDLVGLKYLAHHDHLTGVSNRAKFLSDGQELIANMASNDKTLVLAFVDVDKFKSINDSFGHAVGDEALTRFGDNLRQTLRDDDIVGRWGGDEFVLMAQGVNNQKALSTLGRRLVKACRNAINIDGNQLAISASIGLVSTNDRACNLAQLIQNADHAMLECKRGGGDQFKVGTQV